MKRAPNAARLRRQLLQQPGITRGPVCPHCGQERPLEDFVWGGQACVPCIRRDLTERRLGMLDSRLSALWADYNTTADPRDAEVLGAEIESLSRERETLLAELAPEGELP